MFVLITTFIVSVSIYGQNNVGIGTASPNANAALDIVATDKGVLIPRVALTSTNASSPLGSFVAGMMVYNTATTGDVTPGFYFCNGTKWERPTGGTTGGWSLTGNSGTNPTVNFIGTTDDKDLVFQRNSIRAGLINESDGNTSFGIGALNVANTGEGNTAIGGGVLTSNTTGEGNTALGIQSLISNTEGNYNIGIGILALGSNKTGNGGIAIGAEAMKYVNDATTPYENSNIAIGNSALEGSNVAANNTGLHNNIIGKESLKNNTTGSRNNSLGTSTLQNNISGSGNVAIGYGSLFHNEYRSELVAVGDSALYNNGLGASVSYHSVKNTAVGGRALLRNTVGDENTAIGHMSMYQNIDGYFNTAIGTESIYNNKSGQSNTAVGTRALYNNEFGSNNTALGTQALYANNFGTNNTAIGQGALYFNNLGFNTAVGAQAGLYNEGTGNVFIGNEAGLNETGSNKLYINNNSSTQIGSLIYGEFDTDKLRINDKLGIGILPVSKALEIKGAGINSELMQFYNISGTAKWHLNLSNGGTTLNFAETGVADNRLVLRPGGNVTIGSFMANGYKLSVDGKIACTEVRVQPTSAWPDYVFSPDYSLMPLKELENSINNQKHLPGIPSAKEIEIDGIQVGEIQRLMMEKIEELTLYIIDLNKKIESLQSENNRQADQIKTLSNK